MHQVGVLWGVVVMNDAGRGGIGGGKGGQSLHDIPILCGSRT